MNSKMNVLLRIILTFIIGVLLVWLGADAASILVTCIGIVFIIAGVAVLSYFFYARSRRQGGEASKFDYKIITGIASILFGAWLVLDPSFFVNIFMIFLGVLLAVMGFVEIVSLSKVPTLRPAAGFYVTPALIMIAGVLIIFNPFAAASIPFYIAGFGTIVYAICDLINYIRFFRTPVVKVIEEVNQKENKEGSKEEEIKEESKEGEQA